MAWAGAIAKQGLRSAWIVLLNGLATDGEPRTCKREQGKRSAAQAGVRRRHKEVPSTDPLRQVKSEVPRHLLLCVGAKAALVDPSTRGINTSLYGNRGARWFWRLLPKQKSPTYGAGAPVKIIVAEGDTSNIGSASNTEISSAVSRPK